MGGRAGRRRGLGLHAPGLRLSVRILSAGEEIRAFEVEGEAANCDAGDVAVDFPGSVADAEVAVAQWGETFGWGVEARAPLL